MGFFDKLSNGWEIAKTSLSVLRVHKELIVFPILSGISLTLIMGSFVVAFAGPAWTFDTALYMGRGAQYLTMFLFYVINYFIIVFFNMGLMHCAKLYFDGQEVTVAAGLKFSFSRIGSIFVWALFAATVGFILKFIQENVGWLGKIITGIIGIVWSAATFFVIPVLAYENVGPTEAVKRSAQIMREKWGESLGATFSFGLIQLVAFLCLGIAGFTVGYFVNEVIGIGIFVVGIFAMFAVASALRSIFISAVYNGINGNINDHFTQQMIDGLFEQK